MPPEIPADFDFRIPDGDPAPVEGIFAFDPINSTVTFTLDVEPTEDVDAVSDPLVELGPFDVPDAVLDLIA